MNTVRIRNTVIGEGMPKICIPIVGVTREEILEEAEAITKLPADVVEWRADWYDKVFDYSEVETTMKCLREILGDMPILMTFRTSKEGGEKAISDADYAELNIKAARSGLVDIVDVEAFTGDELVTHIIEAAHTKGVKVVGSNHDFGKTPTKDEIVGRLRKMQELGVDIPKIAVMPNCKRDVLTLLEATEEMSSKYADRPIITMSMAENGIVSRISGEFFGSAMTFGSAGRASAPGQIGAEELRTVLEILHN